MIFVPAKTVDAWRALLANPDRLWAVGQPARSLAHAWFEHQGLPPAVRQVIDTSPALKGTKMIQGFVQHNDLTVLGRTAQGALAVLAVEPKTPEPFGPTVVEWLSDDVGDRRRKLDDLTSSLGLTYAATSPISYELLHRMGTTLEQAVNFNARHAVLILHSFGDASPWQEAFSEFVRALGGFGADIERTVQLRDRIGIQLYVAWARDEDRYLSM